MAEVNRLLDRGSVRAAEKALEEVKMASERHREVHTPWTCRVPQPEPVRSAGAPYTPSLGMNDAERLARLRRVLTAMPERRADVLAVVRVKDNDLDHVLAGRATFSSGKWKRVWAVLGKGGGGSDP
ncbi:MAG TPA: hypothetical protein VHL31_10760 [Geminicoccus sp.]|jgi:hypothetical protein|uniref:hypothetical protein n=1 Tax=Geminicoccus sp. TaxID=2024832 RepID=UPI002E2EC2E0|nr:hypothetical protein [Geminicoccus sp.]HEX2526761.1 hypothetical protein [Geminicoccus sp.]